MSIRARVKAQADFSSDAQGSPTVLLVSLKVTETTRLLRESESLLMPFSSSFPLKAGGTGLNLTRASCVVLLDLWWNAEVSRELWLYSIALPLCCVFCFFDLFLIASLTCLRLRCAKHYKP
jgi:hypothetical protein